MALIDKMIPECQVWKQAQEPMKVQTIMDKEYQFYQSILKN